ncbi:MAG TPA: asparagine synthase C-terminal domain-containing protein [Candidatus Ruania gallistercoris]|uniref:asparagine synthase (glutamine-hydrolyzing) n=1 Tax=Candidatus Ruania gallistercoris TaxID=2838746 RepID=A0A9D2J6F1_9MICO|nr:asparagine synthase C-terminal domain-containing protein [Candidatus Ruania gallistercoris]
MSQELLVVASARRDLERTAATVRYAAERVPGATGCHVESRGSAAVAVVSTDPPGGSTGALRSDAGLVSAVVATNAAGLGFGHGPIDASRAVGSEAGHVRVVIDHQGLVRVSGDGIGAVPLYWFADDDGLYLSTHLASLVSLGVPAEVDDAAALEYLVLLHPLGDRTILDSVRVLPPGGLLEWSPQEGPRVKARPLFAPDADAMNDTDAIERFQGIWATVIGDLFERHGDRRVALGVSGGLDSRAVAAGSALVGARPLTFAYGTEHVIESRVAAEVAATLGFDHLRLPVVDERLMPEAPSIIARLDGVHSPAEMFELWFGRTLSTMADVLVNGAGGGPLWGDEKSMGLRDPRAITAATIRRYSGEIAAIEPYLDRDRRTDLTQVLTDGVAATLSEWSQWDRADISVFWRIANRQVRWGNALVTAVRRAGMTSETPFLDSRFLRFCAALTPEQRLNGHLHLKVHRQLFAQTAGIGRGDDGNSPRMLSHVYWSSDRRYAAQLAELTFRHPVAGMRRVGRRAGVVGARMLDRRYSANAVTTWWDERTSVFPLDLWARTRATLADRLASLAESATAMPALVSEDALASATSALRAGRGTSVAALAKVATLGHWLNDFRARELDFRRATAGGDSALIPRGSPLGS